MGWVLQLVVLVSVLVDEAVNAALVCERVPISLCCTSRIRQNCPQLCSTVQCASHFYQKLFSLDLESAHGRQSPRDGSARLSRNGTESVVKEQTTSLPRTNIENSGFFSAAPPLEIDVEEHQLPVGEPTGAPTFPTLIPFARSIDETPQISKEGVARVVKKRIIGTRRRTTPDPRIIPPPSELVFLGEYDYEQEESETLAKTNETVDNNRERGRIVRASPQFPQYKTSMTRRVTNLNMRNKSEAPGFLKTISVSHTFLKPQHLQLIPKWHGQKHIHWGRVADRDRTPRLISSVPHTRKTSPPLTPLLLTATASNRRSAGKWSVSIVPKEKQNKISHSSSAVDGDTAPIAKSSLRKDKRFNKAINTLINTFSLGKRTIQHISSGKSPQSSNLHTRMLVSNLEGQTVKISPQSTSNSQRISAGASQVGPQQVSGECGKAPDYTPCVPSHLASHALLSCCQAKGLPVGCLPLCRYDITQTEIRQAIDRGACGIFNVAPFVECAAQGKNNLECCRKKGIVSKTGKQCEQFCDPSAGLTALGLQHVVCGNAIGDMMQCHHAGITSV